MSKTSKVTDVIPANEWNGPNGKVYYSKIVLENGDSGEIGTKKPNGISVGDTLTYELTQTEHGNKIKRVTDNGNGFQGSGNGGSRQSGGRTWPTEAEKHPSFALAYAKDTIVGMLETGNETLKGMSSKQVADATVATAETYLNWLRSH